MTVRTKIIEIYRGGNPRILVMYLVVLLILLYLGFGLALRQLIQSEELTQMGEHMALRRVLLPAPRGEILDREGRILVTNTPRLAAVIYLNDLRNQFRKTYLALAREAREQAEKDGVPFQSRQYNELQVTARMQVVQSYADELSAILQRPVTVDRNAMDRHFRQNLLLPFVLTNDLTPEEFARLIEQIPSGSEIQLFVDGQRSYPYGDLASHILGYCTVAEESPEQSLPGDGLRTFSRLGLVGRSGVEQLMDETLRGTPGTEILVVDPSGFLFEHRQQEERKQGNPVKLTLDVDLQQVAEQAIGDHTGVAIVMKVKTGEILAMASRPGFDLNLMSPRITPEVWRDITERGALLNRAIRGLYPPGSTFKLITAMAALSANTITPETTSDCIGYYQVGDRRFPCNNRGGHGVLDLSDSLCVSCNVYFYQHGVATGIDQIASFARLLGLDNPTGIELREEETRMLIPSREWKQTTQNTSWFPGDTANTSIGQGYLLMTPLQVACFTASLARGEIRTTPHILYRGDNPPVQTSARLPLSSEQLSAIYDGMHRASTEGTARLARIPNVNIAAKTGTAQIRPRGMPLQLAWFTGFAPIEDPEIVVTVMIEGTNPGETLSGGVTSGPIARSLFRSYFAKHPPQI
jgi:penicillin-binding protein 2